MANDLQARIDAYAGLASDETPRFWTPEIVGQRMIEAFDVLARLPSNWRPKSSGNAWPAMLKEWSDLLDEAAWNNAMAVAEARQERGLPPDMYAMSRAEEALAWPMQHLADQPLHSDALQVWARCLSSGYSIRQLLAARAKKARLLADQMTADENARRAVKRRELAVPVAKWANRKLRAAGDDPAQCRNIKANANIRFRRSVDEADAWNTVIKPAEAMPGRVRAPMTLSRYCKAACNIICDCLNHADIAVRVSAADVTDSQ